MTGPRHPLPSGVEVRPLTVEDIGAAAAIVYACDETYVEWMPEGWQVPPQEREAGDWAKALEMPGGWTLGASEGEGLIAVYAMYPTAGEEGKPDAGHVSHLFVHPDHWRRGIAAALLELGEAEMREQGLTLTTLSTPRGAPARHFYEHLGWRPTGRDYHHEELDLHTVGLTKSLLDG